MYIVYMKVNIIELVVQLSGNIDMASTLPVNRLHINHPVIIQNIQILSEYFVLIFMYNLSI